MNRQHGHWTDSWQVFGDTGATLNIVPCNSKTTPSGPFLKGADGQPIASWGFVQKTVQFQGKLFSSQILQAAVAGPILGIEFLRRFKVTVTPETSQIFFAWTAAAPSAPQSYLPSFDCSVPPPVSPPAGTASPPAAWPDRIHQVKPASFECRGNQSTRDPPSTALPVFGPNQMQPIPDSVLADVKILLQKFPSILEPGMWSQHQSMGLSNTSTPAAIPQFSQSPAALIRKNLKLPSSEFKRLESAGIIRHSKSPWASPLHMVPQKDRSWRPCGDYRRLNFCDNPGQVPFANMQDLSNGLHGCSLSSSLSGLSPNLCCSVRHPKNGDYHAIWLVWVFIHTI